MADLAKLVVEVDASQADAAKRKLDDLSTSATKLDAAANSATRGTKAASDGIKSMSDSVGKATNSFGLAGHQVKNLTAQVVDFGVQVSSGGGFLLPIIQQGPQAIDALGGVSGAINAAGQAFLRFGGIVGPLAASVTAVFASLRADGAIRDMERLADRFSILQNRFGRGLSGSEVQRQLNGVQNAAERTGVSINSLANAQRDFVEATMRGGSLTKNGVFGIDVGTMEQSTEAVELLARGLEAAGVSAGDAGPLIEAFFASIRRDGQLSAKVLEEIMTVAPKFGKPLIDALGGASSLFYRLSQGAKIGGKDAINAVIGIQRQIEQLEKQHIPSVGAAFSKVGGQADVAFKKIGLAIGGEGVSFANLMAQAVLKIGDGFVYIGQQAASFVASVNSVLAPIDALSSGLGAVLEKVTGLQNFTSPAKMWEATKKEVDGINAAMDTLAQKSAAFQSLSDPPSFIKNTMRDIENLLAILDRVKSLFSPSQLIGSGVNNMANAMGFSDGDSPGDGKKGGFGPEQYGPLLSEMEKQTSLQQTFKDAVNAGADAAKEGATAAQQNKEAAERGFTGLTGTVTNGIGVWKGGNDAVKGGVETNTKSTRDGLKAVENAIGGLGSAMITVMKDGVNRGSFSNMSAAQDFADSISNEWRDPTQKGGGWTGVVGTSTTDLLPPGSIAANGAGGLGPSGSLAGRFGMRGGFLGAAGTATGAGLSGEKAAAAAENTAALDMINRTLGKVLNPALGIGGAINDNMSDNPATPDPYRERNPDYFYNNSTGQVTKEKSQSEVLRSLPKEIAKEIAEALAKAGIVGERIGEAIVQASNRPGVAPTSQDGWLPNRGPVRGNFGPGIYNRMAVR